MSARSLGLPPDLHDYLIAHGAKPDALTAELIAETHTVLPEQAGMQVAPEQAAFLTWLVRLSGARRAVEVGTFTGLSALAVARGLGPEGHLTCFDISARYTAIAQRYWINAGVADRIDLRLGPAAEGLAALPAEAHLDFAFIDADKSGYQGYWDALVPRMRPGGIIAVDNVLWHGRVVEPDPGNADTLAIVRFNEMVLGDERMESVMIPLADGLTLARRV